MKTTTGQSRINYWACSLIAAVIALQGCAQQVGEIKFFGIDYLGGVRPANHISPTKDRLAIPRYGDAVRFNSDPVTIRVDTVYLHDLPITPTLSNDVLVFAEVKENEVANEPPLVTVLPPQRNIRLPGRLNFHGKPFYGPTNFKGHPLGVKFTIVILQKERAENTSKAVSLAEGIANTAVPQYSPITSAAASMLRDLLKSLPDVTFFEYSATLYSDAPEGLQTTLNAGLVPAIAAGGDEAMRKGYERQESWLMYAGYALIQTKPAQGYHPSSLPDALLLNRPQTMPAAKDPLKIVTGDVVLRGDALWVMSGEKDEERRNLDTNYVVFHVDPTALPETSAVLQAAARANQTFLDGITRSSADLAQAAVDLEKHMGDLQKSILRSRVDTIATKLAHKYPKKDDFSKFSTDFDNLTMGLDGGKDDLKAVIAAVKEEWKTRYDSLGAPAGAAATAGTSTASPAVAQPVTPQPPQ